MEKRAVLAYFVADVFTNKSYSGNPLAVVFTEGDLEPAQYENIAREFGYSETSFVYYAPAQKALRVRSFTPTGFEVHGAGHNLLGAVCAALLNGLDIFNGQDEDTFVIMKDARIPVTVVIDNKAQSPSVKMKQRTAVIGNTVPVELIADALGLCIEDIGFQKLLPTIVKTEVAHIMVPIVNLGALYNIKRNSRKLIEISKQFEFEGFYCFAFAKAEDPHVVESRFFNPLIGIDEDAATGTAAGPLAGFLALNHLIKSGMPYKILQGVQLNQPSTIEVMVRDTDVLVGGSSVITMKGEVYL